MRSLADAARIHRFMRALGAQANSDCRIYLTGGATAVLIGWRATTIDVDIKGLVDAGRFLEFFERIAPALYRYPSIDPASFGRAVAEMAQGF